MQRTAHEHGWVRARVPKVAAAVATAIGLSCSAGCYDTGDGRPPPLDAFYFPTGLEVSRGGSVLYVVNSDFDLQYNGGTLQSYDLLLVREHAARTAINPDDPVIPRLIPPGQGPGAGPACPGNPPAMSPDGSGKRHPLGQSCAPPTDSSVYVRDAAILGAFATTMEKSRFGDGDRGVDRLFVPVRGSGSLSWAEIARDTPDSVPSGPSPDAYPPFRIQCGERIEGRCSSDFEVGNAGTVEPGRQFLIMPGEPFGMAQSEDGAFLVLTHQTEPRLSLFSTGLAPFGGTSGERPTPALRFVLDGMPVGGMAVAAVPQDPLAFDGCTADAAACEALRPAFIHANRSAPQLNLVRYYDDAADGTSPSQQRPFLVREGTALISVNASGLDSRSVLIDPSPRLACQSRARLAREASGGGTAGDAELEAEIRACARKPARLFVANRSPASLLVGEVGEAGRGSDGGYDATRVSFQATVPLSNGPSRLYLAPIVDADGLYALRVFAVCFDTRTVYIYDPDRNRVENIVFTGEGPYAMAFDAFDLADVIEQRERRIAVPLDPRFDAALGVKRYRFGYLASFTNSFVQVLDLDQSLPTKDTFETVVFSLGTPTKPKGTK